MSTHPHPGADEARSIYLARQPIFDLENHVHAYEILFRSTASAVGADGPPDAMGPRVLVDSLLGIGLTDLTGGRPAYVNVDRALIVDGAVELLDPAQVVVEVLERVTPDEAVVEALEGLVAKGYPVALNAFEFRPGIEAMLLLASVVKIDVLRHQPDDLARLVDRLRPFGAALLAEKVEDAATHARCLELGFEYFQGFHFSRPQTLERKDLSIEQLNVMRLLNVVDDPLTSDLDLESIFRGDVALSYKLLRMVNSAAVGGRGIASIGHAIRLLGRRTLYRWLALMVTSGGSAGGPRGELVHSALLRARMAEGIALRTGASSMAPALYLCGLFSRLDALLNTPMEDLLDRLDLRPEVFQALVGRRGPLAPILALVEAYEAGRWADVPPLLAAARAHGVDLREAYFDALQDADRHLAALKDSAARAKV
jgi:c-di-GMP phosphodiesterase